MSPENTLPIWWQLQYNQKSIETLNVYETIMLVIIILSEIFKWNIEYMCVNQCTRKTYFDLFNW